MIEKLNNFLNISKENSKFLKFIKTAIVLLFTVLITFILVCLFIPLNFDVEHNILRNIFLLFKGIILCILTYLVIKKYYDFINQFVSNNQKKILISLSLVMLIIQLCIVYYGFFITGWDIRPIMHDAIVYANQEGEAFNNVSAYFSIYPNNLLLCWLFIVFIKISNYVVGGSVEFAYQSILILQCFISTFVGYLTFKIIYSFTKNSVVSLIGWIIYFLFIGTSPWLLIPYTDSLGLFFPITMVRVYQLYKMPNNEFKNKVKYVFVLGFLSYIAFRIKPQAFIMIIAIIMFELVLLINKIMLDYKGFLKKIKKIIVFITTFAISVLLSYFLVNNVMIKSTQIKLDKEREFGFTHFFMMGLNEECHGLYCEEDFIFSNSIISKKERAKANVQIALQRINDMKFNRLSKHIISKVTFTYKSGTFGWGEGGTLFVTGSNRDTVFSPIVKSFYYNGEGEFYGANFHTHYNLKQMIWLVILYSLPLSILVFKRKEYEDVFFVMILSIIGLTIFLAVFEAHSRYLFTYSPIFMIISLLGLYELARPNKKESL